MTQLSPAEEASVKALQEVYAAIDEGSCFRLEAGAGAGKTYSLIMALKYLIQEKDKQLSINQQKIACITYTNVAKDEIRDRTDNNPLIFADTIHAFCWSLLQKFQVKLRELIPDLSDKWEARIDESCGIANQKVKYDLGFPSINEETISLHHDDVVALMAKLLEQPKFQYLLKNEYPVILIDEYQDTDAKLAQSIVDNLIDNNSGVLIGLFGDHWQKIYGSSACGLIQSCNDSIIEIGKNANFRSDKNIVDCLNRMRPELLQSEVNPESAGNIIVFHSNAWDGARRTGAGGGHWKDDLPEEDAHIYLEKVQELMVGQGWDFVSNKTKILMLTNNVLASEQGYRSLAGCFNNTDDYLKNNNAYIKFFLDVIEPVAHAFEQKLYGELFQVMSQKFPHLTQQNDKQLWSENLGELIELRQTGTIGDVLDLLYLSKRPRLSNKVEQSESRYKELVEMDADEIDDEQDKKHLSKIAKLRGVDYQEVIKLGHYIDEKTPFSTKHGVKGAQFDNVLVVCGRGWNHYNWNQMLEWFGDGPPANKQGTFERNRNLFYVACSRTKHNLTLLFTQELSDGALSVLSDMFEQDNIVGDPLN
ncbi:UvrD-helicase domain-containing protein [Pseudomonadota bacterium]